MAAAKEEASDDERDGRSHADTQTGIHVSMSYRVTQQKIGRSGSVFGLVQRENKQKKQNKKRWYYSKNSALFRSHQKI